MDFSSKFPNGFSAAVVYQKRFLHRFVRGFEDFSLCVLASLRFNFFYKSILMARNLLRENKQEEEISKLIAVATTAVQ